MTRKPKKTWEEHHTATLRAMFFCAYDHEIAKVTGHCVDTVQRRRAALGLPAYRGAVARYGSFPDLSLSALKAIRIACGKVAA